MIKQCKGKVPKSKLEDLFYLGIKYDVHYVQNIEKLVVGDYTLTQISKEEV